MKKNILLIILLMITFSTVNAKEMQDSEIKNGSIIIGTHLFEPRVSNPSIGYDGHITVRIAMLGASTIDSEEYGDMTMYYKYGDGDWVDYITDDSVTMPNPIKICYVNGVYTNDADCIRSGGGTTDTIKVKFARSEYNAEKEITIAKNGVIGADFGPKVNQYLGHKFKHWSKAGETDPYDFTQPITEDLVLEARWDTVDYTIIYHSNFGATDHTENITCKYYNATNDCAIKNYNDVLSAHDNVGNELVGWSTKPFSAGLLEDDATIDDLLTTLDEDDTTINLYAIWAINSYSLTYKGNGEPQVINCNYGIEYSLSSLTPETRKGYEVEYWYFIVEEAGVQTKKIVPASFKNITSENNKDIEIFASYKPYEYMIKYNTDGGILDDENPSTIKLTTTGGVEISNLPRKDGYTFDGWTVEEDEDVYVQLTKTEGTQIYTITLDETKLFPDDNGFKLKAKWLENTVTINLQDEDGNPYIDDDSNARFIKCNYSTRNDCKIAFNPGELPDASTEREFFGWETMGIITRHDNAFSTAAIYSSPTASITVKAVFTNREKYSVDYDLDGGAFDADAEPVRTFNLGARNLELPTGDVVKKKGYIFDGWVEIIHDPTPQENDDESSAEDVNRITQLVEPIADVYLKALWKPITYTVELYNDDTKIETLTCKYDEDCTIHSASFDSNNFIGWGVDKNTLLYGDNQKVQNLSYTEGGVVKLYAVLGAYHNVSFFLDGGTLTTPINTDDVISIGSKTRTLNVNLSAYAPGEASAPTKEGYTFIGWQYGNTMVDDTGIVEVNSDTLFVAKWEINKYTVTLYYGQTNKIDIEVEHGNIIAYKDMIDVNTTGKWVQGDNTITSLDNELKTKAIVSDLEYRRIYNVKVASNTGTKTEEIVAGNKAYDKFNTVDLTGTWYINNTENSDLENYLKNTDVSSDLNINKQYLVTFEDNVSGSPGNVQQIKAQYSEKVDSSTLIDAVKNNNWYSENHLYGSALEADGTLNSYFINNTITKDIKFTRAYKLTFNDNTSKSYYTEYNKKFDKTRLSDTNILTESWYLVDTAITDIANYLDTENITKDLTFEKGYAVTFYDNTTVIETPYIVKYNQKLSYTTLPTKIKDSKWIIGDEQVDLEEYLTENNISNNLNIYKAYEVNLEYKGGPTSVYVKSGSSAVPKLNGIDLTGNWMSTSKVTDLPTALSNISGNVTYKKMYNVTINYSGNDTTKDVVEIPYGEKAKSAFEDNGINFNSVPYNGKWLLGDVLINDLNTYLTVATVNDNIVLDRAYKVTLNYTGGPTSVYVKFDSSAVSKLSDIDLTGNWTGSSDTSDLSTTLSVVSSDVTYTKLYTITLNYSGNNPTIDVQRVPFDTKAITKFSTIDFSIAPYSGNWLLGDTLIDDLNTYLSDLTVTEDLTLDRSYDVTLKDSVGVITKHIKEGTTSYEKLKNDITSNGLTDSNWFVEDTLEASLADYLKNTNITKDTTITKAYKVTLNYDGNAEKDSVDIPYGDKAITKFSTIDFSAIPYNGKWKNGTTDIAATGLQDELTNLTVTKDETYDSLATLTLIYSDTPKTANIVGGKVVMSELEDVDFASIGNDWIDGVNEVSDLQSYLTSGVFLKDTTITKMYTVELSYTGNTTKDTVKVKYGATAADRFEMNGVDFDASPYNGKWLYNDGTNEISITAGGLKVVLNQPIKKNMTIYIAHTVSIQSSETLMYSTFFIKKGELAKEKIFAEINPDLLEGKWKINGVDTNDLATFIATNYINTDYVIKKVYHIVFKDSDDSELASYDIAYDDKLNISSLTFAYEDDEWSVNGTSIPSLSDYLNDNSIKGDLEFKR